MNASRPECADVRALNAPSIFGDALVALAARPVSLRLVADLAASLDDALRGRAVPAPTAYGLPQALGAALNAWTLSVSRFLGVQDDIRAMLEVAGASRLQTERVLSDLEAVFIDLWLGESVDRPRNVVRPQVGTSDGLAHIRHRPAVS